MSKPAITIMPHHCKPGLFPGRVRLDDCVWPQGRPDRLVGSEKTLSNLNTGDHLVLFTRDLLYWRPWMGTKARVSVMVLEPKVIHGRHMRWLRWAHRRFHRVLCSHPDLLAGLPNAVLFPLGTSWVPDWKSRAHEKTRMCSLIASGKRDLEGHALRHRMVDWVRAEGLDVDVMGRGYKPFDQKAEGLSPYRFSIVIENVREKNYFTEKLVDAVLCQTLPIYWGCPNIGDFVDADGLLICDSEAEIQETVRSMSAAQYHAMQPSLKRAAEQAEGFADIYERAAKAVLA